MYDQVQYEVTDDVAIVRLNDPATLNAITARLGGELLHALRRGEEEGRAVLLGGVGRGFCSGANLAGGDFDMDDPRRDAGAILDALLNPVIAQIRNCAVPVVTAVRGPAAGIGCGIALAGDMIVASETAQFIQSFRHVGLVPDGGSSYLLSRAIGRVRAMEMMLLGEKLPAAKALEWGLINRVVADDALDEAALALARALAQGPRALGMTKRVAWAALDASFETALSAERVAQREAGRTADFAEGIASFREKRPPSFTGS